MKSMGLDSVSRFSYDQAIAIRYVDEEILTHIGGKILLKKPIEWIEEMKILDKNLILKLTREEILNIDSPEQLK